MNTSVIIRSIIFFILPFIVLVTGYFYGFNISRIVSFVNIGIVITILLIRPFNNYLLPSGILAVLSGFVVIWLTRKESERKVVESKLYSEKETEHQKAKSEQDQTRTLIFQEEKRIKKLLYLYEITKKIATTLNWEEMMNQFNLAIQDYLGVREVLIFVPNETKQFSLVSKRGSSWSGEEKRIEQTHNFVADKKISFESTNLLLTIPLWLENELLATFILKMPQKTNFSAEELLFESEALSNQLILGIKKANLYREVERRSRLDGLTGLYRRHYFFNRLEDEIRRSKKFNTVFCIVITDIDHFKQCNDTYGHQAGDEVLRSVSKAIKENIYETDIVARYGGEEFVLLLPNADLEGTYRKMDNIRTKIAEQELVVGFEKIRITSSFGISQYPANGMIGEELLRCADEALYFSKNNGRNRVTTYNQIRNRV